MNSIKDISHAGYKNKAKYFIPTLYFIEGLPYTIVNTTSVVVLKSLGASNELIGLSSFLSLPWALKFLWAPLVDVIANKKKWVIVTQTLISILLIVLAISVNASFSLPAFIVALALLAVTSATQDVAIDGYYLEVMDLHQQAFYVGIRNTFYRFSMLFAGGVLVFFAGSCFSSLGVRLSWSCAFAIVATVVAAATLFHSTTLPEDTKHSAPDTDASTGTGVAADINIATSVQNRAAFSPISFLPILRDYLDQPGIVAILIYVLTFRLGDALMLKMAQPFLLDTKWHGGLGMSMSEVGIIYGTIGTAALLLGGITGSYLIAADGLKRWLLPFAVLQNLAIPLYWCLAIAKPGIVAVTLINFIEQAAYGLGITAFTIFILQTAKANHRAAHYAIATALMAAGMLLPSAASGILQEKLGYSGLFFLSTLASVPGIISIFFLPLRGVEIVRRHSAS